jgi:hypothetical protein
MLPTTPFWFKQRQAKAEEAAPSIVRVSGPNLREAYLGIRAADDGKWTAFLSTQLDGPDLQATPPTVETAYAAWEAAFEIYRTEFVI